MKIQSSLARNSFSLILGVIAAQTIPVLMSPILTRLYSPAAFGYFAVYSAMTMIMGAISLGKYELAILLPKSDKAALNLFGISVIIACLLGLITALSLFIFNTILVAMGSIFVISACFFALPIDVSTSGLHEALNYWCNRKQQYRLVSGYRILQTLLTAIASTSIALIFKDDYGLILGSITGVIIATSLMTYHVLKNEAKRLKTITKRKMCKLAKAYYRFPRYYIWASLLEKISSQLPILLLALLFNAKTLGLFALAQRVTQLPSKLIARSVADVFLQKINQIKHCQQSSKAIYLKSLFALALIGLLPFLLFITLAPTLFEFVFGINWRISGNFAQLMAPMYYLEIIVTPLIGTFIIKQKHRVSMFIQLVLVFSAVLALLIGKYFFSSALAAIALFCIVFSIKYLIELVLSYNYVVQKSPDDHPETQPYKAYT